MTSRRILIVGGSTRAAADSVRRAGWQPICADLFADQDLRRHAEVIRVRSYPESLPDDLKQVQSEGWFYCGALENHPSLIEQIQTTCPNCGPLLGTPPQTLRDVRNPQWLANLFSVRGLPTLDVRMEQSQPPADGTWLQKPLASAGGRSIRVWDRESLSMPLNEPHYFQYRMNGIGVSASVQISERSVTWLGMTKELRKSHQFSATTEFSYYGSYGPIHDTALQCELEKSVLAVVEQAPGLRGIVGFDFRFDGQTAWLTEVNPRYTASIELIELANRRSALTFQNQNGASPELIAKRILYASNNFTAPDLSELLHGADAWTVPRFADIPVPGTPIVAGWPICSVFATGVNEAALWLQLEEHIRLIETALGYR